MAINQNHPFEELGGVKCAVVERNVPAGRVAFLKELLEHNGFEVVTVPSPPDKAAVATPPPALGEPALQEPALQERGETFTVGVTDLTYNTVNAIFGRLLRTRDGHVVTRKFWQQQEQVSHDDIPYFDR
jgi:hypothetical protein